MLQSDHEGEQRRNPLATAVRFLLHWLIKLTLLVILGLRRLLGRRPVRYGLLALLLIGAFGWQTLGSRLAPTQVSALSTNNPSPVPTAQSQGVASAAVSADGDIPVQTAGSLPRSPVVERHIQALADFDAQTMWGMFSAELQEYMQTQADGRAVEALQEGLDSVQLRGGRYVGGTYVGGARLSNGDNVYLYVLHAETPEGSVEIPHTYRVNPDGKIAGVDE